MAQKGTNSKSLAFGMTSILIRESSRMFTHVRNSETANTHETEKRAGLASTHHLK